MALFNVRLDDQLAGRFDAWAEGRGGRSAALRHVIRGACQETRLIDRRPAPAQVRSAKLTVRLSAADARGLAAAAEEMELTPNGWAAAVLRWRLAGRVTFSPAEAAALQRIQGEIHRIGININQIARALNTAVMEGKVLDLEMAAIADLRTELRAHMSTIGQVHAGLQGYWGG